MLKEDSLKGKNIIITGGGTGLGKAMAKHFLQLGAKVLICSRRQEVIEATAKELGEETKGEIIPFQCDVRDYERVEACLEYGISQFGQINGLVNAAAGNFISPTERLSHRAFDTVVDIVLKGSYNFTLAAGKYWIKEKIAATILNIVTTYSWTGSGYVVPSACGKAGVLALTRSLAAEWAKYNIRSNAIAPGAIYTEGAFSRLYPEAMHKILDPKERLPMKRFAKKDELSNLASYLMSDFSEYINGEVITMDGAEWIYNAGEFTAFDKVPKEVWDFMAAQREKKK